MINKPSAIETTRLQDTGKCSDQANTSQIQCSTCNLRAGCLPAELEGQALANFERHVRHLHRPVKAGEVLVHQGSSVQSLFALRVGALKAVISSANGDENVVGFRFPGSVIGLIESEQPHWRRSYIAVVDSWVCHIPASAIQAENGVRRQLIRLMGARLREKHNVHLQLASNKGDRKLLSFLIQMSDNHRARGLSASRFYLPMTYIDLASYLGMRHESVSRTLAQLQEAGLIEKKGKLIQIPDLAAIRRLAEE